MTPQRPDLAIGPAEIVHASCVAVGGKGILISGPSGSGKSALALQLMALGGTLIADDRTLIQRQGNTILASCPPALIGLIEARGIGILRAETMPAAPVQLVIDLSQTETARLPPRRSQLLQGVPVDVLFCVHQGHFPAAILHYIKLGRAE